MSTGPTPPFARGGAEPLRSALFVPGNRPRMIEKARGLDADALILDLEDSLPAAEKSAARQLCASSVEGLARTGRLLFVRVNSLASGLIEEDLGAVVRPGVDGICLPKVDTPADVERVGALLDGLERERGIPLGTTGIIALVETARGTIHVHEIATAARVMALAFGAEDFALDLGVTRSREGTEVAVPRAWLAIAACAAVIPALDTPCTDFRDSEALERDCRLARQLGYQGKLLIHPAQVQTANHVFRPSPKEVEHARRILAAFLEAVRRSSAATSVNGRMVDTPVAERARRLIALEDAIAAREQKGPA